MGKPPKGILEVLVKQDNRFYIDFESFIHKSKWHVPLGGRTTQGGRVDSRARFTQNKGGSRRIKGVHAKFTVVSRQFHGSFTVPYSWSTGMPIAYGKYDSDTLITRDLPIMQRCKLAGHTNLHGIKLGTRLI